LLAGLPTHGKECAVAHLNQYIYVIWRFCDTVKVFQDAAPYDWQKDITIPGIDPRCITSCRIHQLVYILDWRDHNIWKLLKDGTIAKFESSERARCMKSLSCVSGRLLVVGDKELSIYGPDDALIKTVALPEEMSPQHAVETPRGTFVVSHTSREGAETGESTSDRVSEINGSGQVVKVFGGEAQGKLKWPYHVAMDPEGRVFVADFGNRRVLMLNSELEMERVVVGEGQGPGEHRWTSRGDCVM
jgi:DNA-binding beta-propeller fold protein YncE